MKEKISFAIKKCKSILIIVAILWMALSIVFIAPITVSIVESNIEGNGTFFDILIDNAGNVGDNLSKCFKADYRHTFLTGELYLILGLAFCGIIGVIKTLPKNEYTDIEHGSSDWANGDQYSILSRNKGIILAEKHYLPVDKRGNVNVLVVGRFRFW